jgi:S-adenosylmethionine-dependent methyltransferase
MAPTPETAFEANAQRFAAYGEEVRGFVRYEVVHHNLTEIMRRSSLRVADIGGGSGIDSIWAAEQGHRVTLLEPAATQRRLAKKRIAQADPEVQQRITIVPGVTTDLLAAEAKPFDVVLSHGVAMYLPNPRVYLRDLVALTKPNGHISLLEKGYYGTEARLVREGRLDQLALLRARQRTVNNQDKAAWAFKPNELRRMVSDAGASVLTWSGVRVISDAMHERVEDMDPATLKAIVETEIRQGSHPEIRAQGQMLHVIAKRY